MQTRCGNCSTWALQDVCNQCVLRLLCNGCHLACLYMQHAVIIVPANCSLASARPTLQCQCAFVYLEVFHWTSWSPCPNQMRMPCIMSERCATKTRLAVNPFMPTSSVDHGLDGGPSHVGFQALNFLGKADTFRHLVCTRAHGFLIAHAAGPAQAFTKNANWCQLAALS